MKTSAFHSSPPSPFLWKGLRVGSLRVGSPLCSSSPFLWKGFRVGFFLLLFSLSAQAQNYVTRDVQLPVTLYDGDTIPVVHMPDVYIYNPPTFQTRRKEKAYWRLVANVRKTLPLAREIRGIIIETYEYLMTLPDDKARERHMKAVEDGLLEQYTPRMRKLTLTQGKLLIRLVDRECNQTGYELIRVFTSPFKAGFYQAFAALFGASLKKEYNPDTNPEDAQIEEIIFMLDNGIY